MLKRGKRKGLFATMLLCSIVPMVVDAVATEHRWTVDNYPNAIMEYKECSRESPSYVCDPDQVLSKTEVDELNAKIEHFENETGCACDNSRECIDNIIADRNSKSGNLTLVNTTMASDTVLNINEGFLIGIAIVERLPYTRSRLRRRRAGMNFVRTLRRRWELGRCGNDVMLFMDANTKRLFVSVGKATEKRLTEDQLYAIHQSVDDDMKNGNFFKALVTFMSKLEQQMNTEHYIDNTNFFNKLNEFTISSMTSIIISIVLVAGCFICIALTVIARHRSEHQSMTKVVAHKEDLSTINHEKFTDIQQY